MLNPIVLPAVTDALRQPDTAELAKRALIGTGATTIRCQPFDRDRILKTATGQAERNSSDVVRHTELVDALAAHNIISDRLHTMWCDLQNADDVRAVLDQVDDQQLRQLHLDVLPPRHAAVVAARHGLHHDDGPMRLVDVGNLFGISREAVRVICSQTETTIGWVALARVARE